MRKRERKVKFSLEIKYKRKKNLLCISSREEGKVAQTREFFILSFSS